MPDDKDLLTIEQLANETLISYHPSFTGRKRIDAAFAQRRLKPNIPLPTCATASASTGRSTPRA